jgi:hypothetical protein
MSGGAMVKPMKSVLVRIDEDVYQKILKEIDTSSNGKFGSGLAGYIKKMLYSKFGVEIKNYHDNPRGPKKKVVVVEEAVSLEELFS